MPKSVSIAILVFILFSSCLKTVYYSADLNNGTITVKTSFTNGKVVQRIYTIPYHGGAVSIYHDFTFEKNIIVSLKEAYVTNNERKWPLNFIGSDIKKDTVHIDGDGNLSTVFSIPPWYKPGDTIEIHLDDFLKDVDGVEYKIDPLYLALKKSGRRK